MLPINNLLSLFRKRTNFHDTRELSVRQGGGFSSSSSFCNLFFKPHDPQPSTLTQKLPYLPQFWSHLLQTLTSFLHYDFGLIWDLAKNWPLGLLDRTTSGPGLPPSFSFSSFNFPLLLYISFSNVLQLALLASW